MTNLSKNSIRWFFLTGLGFAIISSIVEVLAVFRVQQDWGTLLSIEGLLTVVAFLAFLILGLIVLFLCFYNSTRLNELISWLERLGWIRWLTVAVLILSVAWFYLYSPWQDVLTGPWLQLIFSFGLAAWITLLISPHRVAFSGWEEFIFAFGLFLFPRIVLEMRLLFTQAWVYRLAVLLGYLIVLALAVILFSSFQQKLLRSLSSWRNQLGWPRWLLIALALCGPVLFYWLAGIKVYVTNPNIRFSFLLIELFLVAFLLNKNEVHLTSAKTVLIGAFVLALISALIQASLTVTNYPFSIGWSEGDRLYEDSLIFGQHLYNYSGTIVNPYGSPGSYVLWGSLFLFPGASIELLRLWDVILGVVFPVLAAWILARKIGNVYLRLAFVLWLTLFFIVEAPLHPPFMLAAIIVFAFMSSQSFWLRTASIAVASIYVGLSRWTWIPVTAGWAILIDLILYYPHRTGPFVRRTAPTTFLALIGLVPGLIIGYPSVFSATASTNLTFHQSLLWYRLLPNPTLPLGVLLTAVLYSGPLVAILVWWIASGSWKLDWLQLLAIGIGLAGFFVAGLIVSSKIGGGGDLHNLDMYLMTLVLVFMLGLYNYLRGDNVSATTWPAWLQIALCLAILLPTYSFTPFSRGSAYDPAINLPNPQDTQQELADINSYISHASQQGLVLMVDQRQLLTFNYVNRISFVPDYEKKYMMDQAMGGNAAYFQNYYRDLANKRFSLIVIEVLRLRRTSGAFSDENNDWVDWVSKPTLCFYQPMATYDNINVQLLIPRQDISDCQKFLK
jgi:hypothetical protein